MQVIVDSDATAKALLSNGQLRNRVTIIPLNKVSFQSWHMLTVFLMQGKCWLLGQLWNGLTTLQEHSTQVSADM